jgi:hypothetical protein
MYLLGIYTIESSFCSSGNNKEKVIIKNWLKDMEKNENIDNTTIDGNDSRGTSSQDSNKLVINSINKKNKNKNDKNNNDRYSNDRNIYDIVDTPITENIKLG